jgi:hypothetical protein
MSKRIIAVIGGPGSNCGHPLAVVHTSNDFAQVSTDRPIINIASGFCKPIKLVDRQGAGRWHAHLRLQRGNLLAKFHVLSGRTNDVMSTG